jgi:hypothetical protein
MEENVRNVHVFGFSGQTTVDRRIRTKHRLIATESMLSVTRPDAACRQAP